MRHLFCLLSGQTRVAKSNNMARAKGYFVPKVILEDCGGDDYKISDLLPFFKLDAGPNELDFGQNKTDGSNIAKIKSENGHNVAIYKMENCGDDDTAADSIKNDSDSAQKVEKSNRSHVAKNTFDGATESPSNDGDSPDDGFEFTAEAARSISKKQSVPLKSVSESAVNGKNKTRRLVEYSSSDDDDEEEKEEVREKIPSKTPFKCSYEGCSFETPYKNNVKKHVDAVHLKLKRFHCSQCDYGAYHRYQLASHVTSHHGKVKEKLFVCNVCDFRTDISSNLKRHVDAVHLGLKNYKCTSCQFSSSSKIGLEEHVDAAHLNVKKHECPICDFHSATKRNLKAHVDAIHLGLKDHKCTQCDFSSTQKPTLKEHIEAVHMGLKEHSCSECDLRFARKSGLKRHVNGVHKKGKDHKCMQCEFSTAQKWHLKRHVDAVHKKV